MSQPVGWHLGDEEFFRQAAARLVKEQRPWYALLISLTSHHPYPLPEQHRHLNVAPYDGTILGDYLQAVHYADRALGLLLDELERSGLKKETVVVLFGDHDAALAKEPVFSEFLGLDASDAFQLARIDRVPLLIRVPGAAGKRMGQAAGLVDLPPTLLSLTGITEPTVMLGRPLQLEQERLVVLRDGSFTDGERYGLRQGNDCRLLASGERLPAEACLPGWERAAALLRASDLIIQGDLVPELLESEHE